jgi:hypothetical protein
LALERLEAGFGGKLDAVDDAQILIEINKIEWRESSRDGNAFESNEPEASAGIGSGALHKHF